MNFITFSSTFAQFVFFMNTSRTIVPAWLLLKDGTILGIFLVAFFMKHINANAVFIAAIITELAICYIYFLDVVSFLWLNVFGALLVLLFSQLYYWIIKLKQA